MTCCLSSPRCCWKCWSFSLSLWDCLLTTIPTRSLSKYTLSFSFFIYVYIFHFIYSSWSNSNAYALCPFLCYDAKGRQWREMYGQTQLLLYFVFFPSRCLCDVAKGLGEEGRWAEARTAATVGAGARVASLEILSRQSKQVNIWRMAIENHHPPTHTPPSLHSCPPRRVGVFTFRCCCFFDLFSFSLSLSFRSHLYFFPSKHNLDFLFSLPFTDSGRREKRVAQMETWSDWSPNCTRPGQGNISNSSLAPLEESHFTCKKMYIR